MHDTECRYGKSTTSEIIHAQPGNLLHVQKNVQILLMIFVNICDKMPKLAENCPNLDQNIT